MVLTSIISNLFFMSSMKLYQKMPDIILLRQKG